MKRECSLLIFLIVVITNGDEAACNYSSNVFTATEKNVLQRLSSSINQPFSLDYAGVSSECREASNVFFEQLNNYEFWALQMHDASAKLPSGVFQGNLDQYGDFDQCLSTASHKNEVRGQYCLVNLQVHIPDGLKFIKHLKENVVHQEMFKSTFNDTRHFLPRSSEIHWGLCIPSACTSRDLEISFSEVIHSIIADSGITADIEVKQNQCHMRDAAWLLHLDYATILVIFLFIAFVLLIIAGTVHEKTSSNEAKNQWLTSFSIIKNARETFSVNTNGNEIASLHGVRFINMMLIVLVHKSMSLYFNPFTNKKYLNDMGTGVTASPFMAALIYTEVFLMLSGLLVAYSTLGKLKRGQEVNCWKEIAGRYLRMMPPLAVIVLFSTYVLPNIGSGPLWSVITDQSQVCRKFWGLNILMIQNWFGIDNFCLPQTHHIATDFVLFVASIYLITLLHKRPMIGAMCILSLGMASTFGRFYVTYGRQLILFLYRGVELTKLFDGSDHMYFLPPYRYTSYALGIFLGYILRNYNEIKLSPRQLVIGHVSSLLCLVATLVSLASNLEFNRLNQALFATFAPITFCLFFAWFIFMSHLGYKNAVSKVLEWKYFKVSTNIAYSFYLVQFAVFFFNIGITRSPLSASVYTSLLDFNDLIVLVVAALTLTILVDVPFGNLKKIILDGRTKDVKTKAK